MYNGSNYLRNAIDSALAQTYKNIEVIVVNDGSNDKGATEKIAKSYGDKIRYFRKENGGVSTALNLGIEKMTGDYFSWLSHDDLFRPSRISDVIKVYSANQDLRGNTIIANSIQIFDDKGMSQEISAIKDGHKYKHPLSFLLCGYLNGCALTIPKSVFATVGVFNENLPTTQDFDLWFRMFRSQQMYYLDKPLTLSRTHGDQGSKVFERSHIQECDSLWINIMDTLNTDEKIQIFGGEFEFYDVVYSFLKNNRRYDEATRYARQKMLATYYESLKIDGKVSSEKNKKKLDIFQYFRQGCIDRSRKTIFLPLFGEYYDRGGLNKMVIMLANSMSSKFNVVVAAIGPEKHGYELSKDVSYVQFSKEYPLADRMLDVVYLLSVDLVIVSHCCSADGLYFIEELELSGKKAIAWNHEDYFLPYFNPQFYQILESRNEIFAKLDGVVWLTNASNKAYSLLEGNGMAIPDYLVLDSWNKVECNDIVSSPKKRIIAVARFDDPRKRIGLLLETFEKILAEIPDICLDILGSVDSKMKYNNSETIGQVIKRINKDKNRIRAVGFVKNVEDYYKESDINILPSTREGFGLAIIESAYFGVPTAVFDNSGFSDIIDDGVNGIVSAEADTTVLAKRIVDLYNDKDKLLGMKRECLKLISKFSESKILSRWSGLVSDILSGGGIKYDTYSYSRKDAVRIINNYDNALKGVIKNFEKSNNISGSIFNNQAYNKLVARQKQDNKAIVELLARQERDNKAIIELRERDEVNNQLIAELRIQNASFINSSSWKVTKPLRKAAKIIKTVKKKVLK